MARDNRDLKKVKAMREAAIDYVLANPKDSDRARLDGIINYMEAHMSLTKGDIEKVLYIFFWTIVELLRKGHKIRVPFIGSIFRQQVKEYVDRHGNVVPERETVKIAPDRINLIANVVKNPDKQLLPFADIDEISRYVVSEERIKFALMQYKEGKIELDWESHYND